MATHPAKGGEMTEDRTQDPVQVEDAAASTTTWPLVENAKNASNSEHTMSLREAIRLYPNAIGWSILLSTTLIMEGMPYISPRGDELRNSQV